MGTEYDHEEVFNELFGGYDEDEEDESEPSGDDVWQSAQREPTTPDPVRTQADSWEPQLVELSSSEGQEDSEPSTPTGVLPGMAPILREGRKRDRQRRVDNMNRRVEARHIAMHFTGEIDPVFVDSQNPFPTSTLWAREVSRYPRVQQLHHEDLEPFSIRNGEVFSLERVMPILQAIASDLTRPIQQRKHTIVRLMNSFFCKLNSAGTPMVGMVMPCEGEQMKGRMQLVEKTAKAFQEMYNWSLIFSVCNEEEYSDEKVREIKALFYGSVVTATAERSKRKARGRPPKRRRGEQLWDANDPHRNEGGSVKQVTVDINKMWYKSASARTYEGTYFRPVLHDPDNGGKLNLYEGLTWLPNEVEGAYHRHEKAWDKWDHHIKVVLADGNEEFAEWLHYFVWHAITMPHEVFEAVPVLVGVQGCGKNNFFQVLEGIIGAHYCMVTARMEDVVGNFTDRMENKLLVLMDEAKRDNGGSVSAWLKALVTDRQMRMRKMYTPLKFIDKFLHLIIFSNSEEVIEVEPGERRYFLHRCSGRYKGKTDYHRKFVKHCHSESGMQAIYDYYLRHYDGVAQHRKWQTGRVLVRTELLMDQQLSSMPPHYRWLYDSLFAEKIVNPHRLLDSKDPVISQLRDAFSYNAEEKADKEEAAKSIYAPKYRADANSRRSWVQVVSVNDLHKSYERTYNRLHARGQHRSINQLLRMIQEVFGGQNPTYKIPMMRKTDITKLADRRQLDAFVRETDEAPARSLEDQYYKDNFVPQPGTITAHFERRRDPSYRFQLTPENDYYVVLPRLKVCQDNFCSYFNFHTNIWEKFKDAADVNTILQGHLKEIPPEATQDERWEARDKALNHAFGFIEDKEEFDYNRQYLMGTVHAVEVVVSEEEDD
jgi:hypothetical protein